MQYRVISTDDHLQELPDTWTSRMSKARWGELIPHLEDTPAGVRWVVHGQVQPAPLGMQVLGATADRITAPKRWEDFPVHAWRPEERIKIMAQDGVDVHAFYGNFTRGATLSNPAFPDPEFRLACIRAYNDFQMDEYADPYPGRFITLAVLPLWDVDEAVQEAERVARRGVSGISFAFPQQFGYAHIGDSCWDRLWSCAQEAGLSINFHIGSGASMGVTLPPGHKDQHPLVKFADDTTKSISANTQVMSTLLFAGFLERFPGLKIVSAESGLGWAPYLLQIADHQWDRQKLWKAGMPLRPSEYFRRQCCINFWFEELPPHLLEAVGVDNIMWLSDFPHATCTWPTSREYLARSLKDVGEADKRKILVENPVKLYRLEQYRH